MQPARDLSDLRGGLGRDRRLDELVRLEPRGDLVANLSGNAQSSWQTTTYPKNTSISRINDDGAVDGLAQSVGRLDERETGDHVAVLVDVVRH